MGMPITQKGDVPAARIPGRLKIASMTSAADTYEARRTPTWWRDMGNNNRILLVIEVTEEPTADLPRTWWDHGKAHENIAVDEEARLSHCRLSSRDEQALGSCGSSAERDLPHGS